jgi:hypothetical protein
MWCKQQGCIQLELLFYGPIASREVRDLEASWKMEWRDFLDCMMGRCGSAGCVCGMCVEVLRGGGARRVTAALTVAC